MENMQKKNRKEKTDNVSRKKTNTTPINIYKILTIILAAALVVALGFLIHNWYVADQADQQYEELASQVNRLQNVSNDNAFYFEDTEPGTESLWDTDSTEDTEAAEETGEEEDPLAALGVEIPQKNLDWAAIREVNKDIYAWIYIPGTEIDYPVLQHPTDDSYYLNYNMNGTKGYPGCIYTELLNRKDFTDFDTVVYGHNMRNASMFATLHYYESQAFFTSSPYVYVYIDDRVLVYEVFASYTGDDRHILYSNDFESEAGRIQYLAEIFQLAESNGRRRDTEVTGDSHILTLSTCVKGKSNNRYLVQAKLLNEDVLYE